MKVLVAEDDKKLREGLAQILQQEGYDVVLAADGNEALEMYRSEAPDFVCLDIMMPGCSGYDVCREIRRDNSEIPLIFISAKSEEIDQVIGLELGGDDFIAKPFGVKEVIARIRAVSRRCLARRPEGEHLNFRIGDLRVSPRELRAKREDEVIELSLRDVKILNLLYENPGVALDRDELYEHCWGLGHLPNSRTVDQHISQLRKRIELDPKEPVIVRTVHGVGYRYDPDPSRNDSDPT